MMAPLCIMMLRLHTKNVHLPHTSSSANPTPQIWNVVVSALQYLTNGNNNIYIVSLAVQNSLSAQVATRDGL